MSILCLHIAFLFLGQFEYFMLKVFHTLSFKWLGLELPSSRSLVTYNASVVQMFAYPFQKRKLISNYHSDTQVNFFELPVDRVVAIVDLTCWLWLMYFITHPSGGKLKRSSNQNTWGQFYVVAQQHCSKSCHVCRHFCALGRIPRKC